MEPHIPDNLDDLFDQAGSEGAARAAHASASLKQQRFEESVVRKLLQKLDLTEMIGPLRKEAKDAFGEAKLLFSCFYQSHPGFPWRLYCQKLPFMHQVTQVDMFRRFSTLPVFKRYSELHAEDGTGKPVVLVFDWPTPENAEKVEGLGHMAMHNLPLDHDCPYTRFRRRFMTDPPQTVHVMRYADLLEGLAWKPS